MKKLIFFIMLIFSCVLVSNAQRIYTTAVDTLNGSETVNFANIQSSTSSGVIVLQALCTELGGTSDGTLILQGSIDGTNYRTISETSGMFLFYPNDTLTITDGAIMQCIITDSPFKYYRHKGTGTAGDTTLVSQSYLPKD